MAARLEPRPGCGAADDAGEADGADTAAGWVLLARSDPFHSSFGARSRLAAELASRQHDAGQPVAPPPPEHAWVRCDGIELIEEDVGEDAFERRPAPRSPRALGAA